MRYGVKDYVLKPVDPDTFHTTIGKVKAELQSIRSKKQKEEKSTKIDSQLYIIIRQQKRNEVLICRDLLMIQIIS